MLTGADQTAIGDLGKELDGAGIERVNAVLTGEQFLSPNKKVQLVNVGLEGIGDDPKLVDAIKEIRETGERTARRLRPGVRGHR